MSRVWTGATPTQDPDAADYELSNEFVANVDLTVSEIWVYGTPDALPVASRKARIWDVTTGLVLASANLPDNLPAGWNSFPLTTPLDRLAGQRFLVSYSSGGKYGYVTSALASPVVSGDGAMTILSHPSSTAGNGRINTTPGSYPTQITAGTYWAVDVEYTIGIGGNTAPVITSLTVSNPTGYQVSATLAATDAESTVGMVFSFDWGDGTSTSGSAATAVHTYSTPGTKAILGKVADSAGATDFAAAGIVLRPALVYPDPEPLITVGVIEPWLFDILSTDADLIALVGESVSGTLSGELLAVPYVTFLLQDHTDIQGVGGQEIMGDCLYMVKAVDRSAGWDTVRPIAERIHALLHRPHTNITIPNGSLTTIRERIIQYPEVEEGVQYRHLGGIYRIQASHDQ